MSRKKSKKYKRLTKSSSDFFDLEDDAFALFKAHVEAESPPIKDQIDLTKKALKSKTLEEKLKDAKPNADDLPEKGARHKPNPNVVFNIEKDDFELFKANLESMIPPIKDQEQKSQLHVSAKKRSSWGKEMTIDLHGKTITEAEIALDAFITKILNGAQSQIWLKVITGKGIHSPNGKSVLASHAHRYLSERYASYIIQIDDAPSDITLRGIPIRGHFRVKLKI